MNIKLLNFRRKIIQLKNIFDQQFIRKKYFDRKFSTKNIRQEKLFDNKIFDKSIRQKYLTKNIFNEKLFEIQKFDQITWRSNFRWKNIRTTKYSTERTYSNLKHIRPLKRPFTSEERLFFKIKISFSKLIFIQKNQRSLKNSLIFI